MLQQILSSAFYLKIWFKISTYIWILTCFYKLVLVIWFPASPFIIIFSAIMLGIAVSPIWVIMLSSVDERNRQTNGLCLLFMVARFIGGYGYHELAY